MLKADTIQEPESLASEILVLSIDELWQAAEADRVDLTKAELAQALQAVGTKHNFGLPREARPTRAQIACFWRDLQLKDLALAQACALGRDTACKFS